MHLSNLVSNSFKLAEYNASTQFKMIAMFVVPRVVRASERTKPQNTSHAVEET